MHGSIKWDSVAEAFSVLIFGDVWKFYSNDNGSGEWDGRLHRNRLSEPLLLEQFPCGLVVILYTSKELG